MQGRREAEATKWGFGCYQKERGEASRASSCGSQKDMFLYLVNAELQEALVEARAAIDVALSFVMELRRLQLNIKLYSMINFWYF